MKTKTWFFTVVLMAFSVSLGFAQVTASFDLPLPEPTNASLAAVLQSGFVPVSDKNAEIRHLGQIFEVTYLPVRDTAMAWEAKASIASPSGKVSLLAPTTTDPRLPHFRVFVDAGLEIGTHLLCATYNRFAGPVSLPCVSFHVEEVSNDSLPRANTRRAVGDGSSVQLVEGFFPINQSYSTLSSYSAWVYVPNVNGVLQSYPASVAGKLVIYPGQGDGTYIGAWQLAHPIPTSVSVTMVWRDDNGVLHASTVGKIAEPPAQLMISPQP